jgi:hypothetical protein
MAVFLTYTAIVMTYVPMLVGELERNLAEQDVVVEKGALVQEGMDPAAGQDEFFEDQAGLAAEAHAEDDIDLTPEDRKLFSWVGAIVLAYGWPFLLGFENAIGILIIGFALYQAWTMTRKVKTEWAGPFRLGSETRA